MACFSSLSDQEWEILEPLLLKVLPQKKATNGIKRHLTIDTHGYHPEYLGSELEKIYPQIMTKIKFELSKLAFKTRKGCPGKIGIYPSARSMGD
jgi:hypothetical protein